MAAGKVDPTSAINPTKTYWIIKVRVVRIWLIPAYPSTSSYHGIEMVYVTLSVFNMSQVHLSSPNDPKTKRVTVDIEDSTREMYKLHSPSTLGKYGWTRDAIA
ncbi:uncharacterized protein G2W53_042310 [Senna tora]|uniref:Uncharacterized protein n=1 Tax=Senna tora TaxID=362788 RepID=A0A834SGJ0_9FABA|nr:uncharacterized protein G2W53_042310 [Senna tora]